MQTEAADRRRQPSRGRRWETGQGRAEPRGNQPRTESSYGVEITRLKEIIATMQQNEKQAGERGRRAEREGEGEEGEETRGRKREREAGSRRAASEGGDGGEQAGRLRWRVHQLEKEKLELTSGHNQEVCRLQAELTRLRSSVERGEAQRVELQYQLTVSCRDASRASELTERAAELQQTVQELQRALDITRHAREEDQQALQQEVEERDRLIQSFSSESQRLHQLLQDHEEALEEAERRMAEVKKDSEREAEVNRRQADELKYLMERGERSRREKEDSDQRVKTLESSLEAERAAHLESKFNSEIVQLRVRDLEAALGVERSGQQEAQCSLELLRAQFREVERAYSLERERSSSTERAQERLQKEFDQCRSDLSVALETERKTTSDLTERLEDEKRRHSNTHTLLEQEAQRRSETEEAFKNCVEHIRETLQLHNATAKDDGNLSPPAEVLQLLKTTLNSCRRRLEMTDKQVQDLLSASEKLQEEIQTLRQLTSDQSRRLEESQQASCRLQEDVTRLRQESSDWSTQSRGLQAELEREREERREEREERERREESEREERAADVQKIADHYQNESEGHLSFLYCIYQRLLAGCVLLDQPQSMLGNFTWEELCEVINEQVDQVTSDLRRANDKIAHLQGVCEKKSVCVRELQRSQECVLSRLEESVRRREEAWSSRHTHTVTELQNELQGLRSQRDSLRDRASSLELRLSSLTCDLSRSRGESSSLLSACALLAGALKHAHLRLQTLRAQKTLLSRRLEERERLEEEVRRLAGALGGEEDEEEAEGKRRALRRWRRSVCVVLAVRRWSTLAQQTTALFHVESGVAALCVCGRSTTATQKGHQVPSTGNHGDEGRSLSCARWLRSKRLRSTILSSVSDLQRALTHTGSSPPDVMSASRCALSRLLDHLLDQSGAASSPSRHGLDEDSLSSRLRLGLNRVTPPRPDRKALVTTLQQHFLLFSRRLHSAELERRSLRLELTNLKRGPQQEREEGSRTVSAEWFHSVCVELRQALSREQEAQTLIQEQTSQLHTHTAEQSAAQHTLSRNTQLLSEARQEVSRKERSLRILGKHLSGVQRERKQLEQRLQRAEDELREAARRKDCLIGFMKAAETSCKEVRQGLVQSRRSPSARPRPLPFLLQLSGAEQSIMGAPEMTACQTLLSTFSQLYHTCSSRIDWLEQEVSAHRSHVTALRGELQDVCLRDNPAFVPVAELPETSPFGDVETPPPVPLSALTKEPSVSVSTAPPQTNPAPSQTNPAPHRQTPPPRRPSPGQRRRRRKP